MTGKREMVLHCVQRLIKRLWNAKNNKFMKSYCCFFVILDDQYVPCKEGEEADIKASIVEIPAQKACLFSQIKELWYKEYYL